MTRIFNRTMWRLKNPTICNILRWFTGSLGQMTRQPGVLGGIRPRLQVLFFFLNSLHISLQKLFFYKFIKIKINSFECPNSIKNYEKNNAWSIRRLINESFVPANYRRLSDFNTVGHLLNHQLRGFWQCQSPHFFY